MCVCRMELIPTSNVMFPEVTDQFQMPHIDSVQTLTCLCPGPYEDFPVHTLAAPTKLQQS